jgi:uncharacterized protein (TIGR04255 family)
MTTEAPRRCVHFGKPPVVEVICGGVFQPIPGFTTARVGQLWNCFGPEFQITEDHPLLPMPIEAPPPGFIRLNISRGSEFPRVWFITNDNSRLLQIQNGRIHLNWRKQGDADPYPEFPALYGEFKDHLATLGEFLAERNLPELVLRQFEISYINIIGEDTVWRGWRQIGRVLPDLAWRDGGGRFLPDPQRINWSAEFSLPEDRGILEVNVSSSRKLVSGEPAIMMELTARGPAREDMDSWFAVGHETIVRGFADLTSSEIQKQAWQKGEVQS